MKMDYQSVMEDEFNKIESTGIKPVLLLQCCCAPCSSAVLERLKEHFQIKIYFYNPNIYPQAEYEKRFEQMGILLNHTECPNGIEIINAQYNQDEYSDKVNGLENEPEGGKRCTQCFNLRLEETARKAKEIGADYFTTTLSVSPHKNSELINKLGIEIGEKYGIKFLCADFKKKEGYKQSIILSKEFDLYRQNYCGCKYSMWFNKE